MAGIILTILMFNFPLQLISNIGTEYGMLKEPIGKHAEPTLRWIDIGFANNNNLGYWDKGHASYMFLHVFNSNPQKASRLITGLIASCKYVQIYKNKREYLNGIIYP